LTGVGIVGSALVYRKTVIHAAFFRQKEKAGAGGQVLPAPGQIGVFGNELLFPDLQRPTVVRLGFRVPPLILGENPQRIQAPGHQGVVREEIRRAS